MTAILQPVILSIYSLITPSYTNFVDIVGKAGKLVCYLRPLLQGWLLPDLNTIPNNWVRENSLWLCGYGIGFTYRRTWLKSCPDLIFLPCIYSFVSLLPIFFVRLGLVQDWPKSL